MIFTSAILTVSLALAAAAQSNTVLDIEAIEAHFSQAGLVGSTNLLASFVPSALLNVTFGGAAISPGQALTQDQVKPTPIVQVTAANSTVSFDGNFTLLMVDAGPVGQDESQGQTRHWLVNDAVVSSSNISSEADTVVLPAADDAVTPYAGPAPASGSGAHRYVILLYAQPATFANPSNITGGVTVIELSDYVQQSGLGSIVAGIYFTVEVGTASATPSATSAVVTSTLPAAQSTGSSGSTKPTSSGAPAPSGTGTSSAASVKMAPLVGVLALFLAVLALM